MNFLIRLKADENGFYDLVEENTWETSPAVATCDLTELNVKGYAIDLTQNTSALSFPRMTAANCSFFGNTYTKFTVRSWIFTSENTRTSQFRLGFGKPGSSPVGWQFILQPSNFRFGWQTSSSGGVSLSLPQKISAYQWYYLEFSFDSGIISCYMNGEYIGTINSIKYKTYIDFTNSSWQFWIGNWFYSDNYSGNRTRSLYYDTIMIDDILEDHSMPKLLLPNVNMIYNNIKTFNT